MTDREMLEFAAKAAGLQVEFIDTFDELLRHKRPLPYLRPPGVHSRRFADVRRWNPLGDDGDALRLAVRLGIGLDRTANRCWAFAAGMAINGVCEEFYAGDPYTATRRAIVRAAAEIGRKLAEEGQKP